MALTLVVPEAMAVLVTGNQGSNFKRHSPECFLNRGFQTAETRAAASTCYLLQAVKKTNQRNTTKSIANTHEYKVRAWEAEWDVMLGDTLSSNHNSGQQRRLHPTAALMCTCKWTGISHLTGIEIPKTPRRNTSDPR